MYFVLIVVVNEWLLLFKENSDLDDKIFILSFSLCYLNE